MSGDIMTGKIEIGKEKYCRDCVEVLAGVRGAVKLDKKLIPVLKAIDKPMELPFLLEEINSLPSTDSLRLALVRVQVDSELKMHEDLNLYQKRHYVAETIEKLLWGELLLERGKEKEDEDKES
jgi:hypothetical protein